MLDTIILQIEIRKCHITDYAKFGTIKERMLNTTAPFSKWANNPTKEDKEKGIYKPRLTIIKRGIMFFLKIEFSAPKLLFGNNLDEVEKSDFKKVVEILQKRILEMGVRIWSHHIENAEVLSFHPSKNILLGKEYTATFAMRELYKINLNKKFDLTKTIFGNNGESLQFYTNRHSFVLYDKINDLNKPSKRAIDKDQTKQQLSLFDYIKKKRKQIEILRIEIRLSHKTKMKEVLKKIEFLDIPLFKNIFKKDLCQKILKLYWKDFFGKNLFLFSINNNPQKILQLIFQKYPKTNIKTAILLTGLSLLCKDDEGIRGFRSIAKNYKPKNNWATLKKYLEKFENDIFIQPMHGFIKDIEKKFNEFEAFKLDK